MEIIRAEAMGMCFGVRDALQIADEVSDPAEVTIHGEIVHNPIVNRQLADVGFRQSPEDDRSCDVQTPLVMITAHGISNRERDRLRNAGKELIDTTCPLVRRVHDAATALAAEGRLVLVVGKPGHVEVRGIVDDLGHHRVIETVDGAEIYDGERIGIVSQTTMPPGAVSDVVDRVKMLNPEADIKVVDTVCYPTKRRQQAMYDLVGQVDCVVVVGGSNSNNTRRLVELCREHDTPAFHIQNAGDLSSSWFESVHAVGLTAGTSTPDQTIDQVYQELQRIASQTAQNAQH